jgi:3-phosphoshikimate 1-carboxyvinyltransferase
MTWISKIVLKEMIKVYPKQEVKGKEMVVESDWSSASYFLV